MGEIAGPVPGLVCLHRRAGLRPGFQDGVRLGARRSRKQKGQGKEAASDARALGLAIPQLGKGDYRVVQELNAEFHEGAEPASFSVRFTGPWERYKRVKQLTDAFGQEATKVTVKTVLRATFPDGLPVGSDQFQTLRDVFTTLGLGKLVADVEEAEPAKEKAE